MSGERPGPQRIVIVGSSSSGKSTLARAIGAKLGLKVVHLDALYWLPNWVECPTPEFRRRVSEALAGDRWVSEGNYATKTWDLRMPRADLVIRLRQPRLKCLRRALWRTLSNYGKTRDDLGPECPERFDKGTWELLRYIWDFDKKIPRYDALLAPYELGDRFIELHGDAGIKNFLRDLTPPLPPGRFATGPESRRIASDPAGEVRAKRGQGVLPPPSPPATPPPRTGEERDRGAARPL